MPLDNRPPGPASCLTCLLGALPGSRELFNRSPCPTYPEPARVGMPFEPPSALTPIELLRSSKPTFALVELLSLGGERNNALPEAGE